MWKRNKTIKKNNMISKYGIIYVTVIIFLNIVGIGYGIWKNEIAIATTVSTGNINTVFSWCEVTNQECEENSQASTSVSADIVSNGKRIDVFIEDAQPGYCAIVTYTIENRGSIPVACRVGSEMNGPVKVKIDQPGGIIDVSKSSQYGTVYINIDDVEQKTDYKIGIGLTFMQYNMSAW